MLHLVPLFCWLIFWTCLITKALSTVPLLSLKPHWLCEVVCIDGVYQSVFDQLCKDFTCHGGHGYTKVVGAMLFSYQVTFSVSQRCSGSSLYS